MDLFWAGLEAVATAVAAIVGVAAAVVAIRTLLAVKQDSVDRSRPVIVADFVLPPLVDERIDLVIFNAGASPARNIQVSFDPSPLVIADDDRPVRLAPYIEKRYQRPVPILTQGARLSNHYLTYGKDGRNKEPLLPDKLTVSVAYEDMEGRHRYRDSFELDVSVLGYETYVRSKNSVERRVADAVEAIARGVGSH